MKNIDLILRELYEISESPVVIDGFSSGISLSTENFKYAWYLNNLQDHLSNYTIKVDSANDAYEIMSKFSGESINYMKDIILKHNTFDEDKPLYLHFVKTIKHL